MQSPAPTGASTPSTSEGERLFGEGMDPRGPGRVLIVANDRAVQSVLATLTTIEGCEAIVAAHGPEAHEAIRAWQPRVVLLDLDDVSDGPLKVLEAYREAAHADTAIIVLSATDLADTWLDQTGAAAALSKPFAAADLLDLLRRFAHCSG
jgi:CheY-like chemotaxis protein